MKYVFMAALASRRVCEERVELLGRIVFYLVILLVFSRLWSVLASERTLPFGAVSFLWYIALTEWIALGAPLLYLEFEEDVRRGDIAYRLTRPGSYLWTKLAEGYGTTIARMGALAVAGPLFVLLFGGGLPADPRGLLLALPLGLLAAAVVLLLQAAVGLSVFWMQEASPLYWIQQKLLFVFGGLLFPLEIYPPWLRGIASWTPFAPVFHGCGRQALAYDPAAAGRTALQLLGWAMVLGFLVTRLYRRGLRVLDVNGG
jgi:ABC-2 type transport system permease protein